MRTIDADAFCGFLREVSTRQHYETLLTKKDRYPTVADVIEEICCDLDGTSLNGFGNCPTVEERPKGKWIPVTERLPEEDEEYLATIQDGYKRYIGVAWYVGRGEWHYCGETMKVIAWQRLPSIYGKER